MLSFNMSKKREKILLKSNSEFVEGNSSKADEDDKEFVNSIDGTQINSNRENKKKQTAELIIPLISRNNWTPRSQPQSGPSQEGSITVSGLDINEKESLTLEQQAVNELLYSSTKKETEVELPLLLQNRIPEGYEEEDNLNVSLRADQSTLEDYERIPIDKFGLAMLRGMGWKKGEGIGLRNKRVVEIEEPRLRPKGLGLGATMPQTIQNPSPSTSKVDENEYLTLKKGAFAIINRGRNQGSFAKVESFDEDNNRVFVRLAIGGTIFGIPKHGITLVPESDFKRMSKVLNNEMYEEYKKLHDETAAKRHQQGIDYQKTTCKETNSKANKKSEKGSSSSSTNPSASNRSKKGDKKTAALSSHPGKKGHTTATLDDNCDWVIANLRVRFIDAEYKNGKYFKKKFILEDVVERNNFVLKGENGEIIDRVKSSQLETVIPKISSLVCVLNSGRKIGKLIDRDSANETGVVEIPDEGVLQLHFNDICEFVGRPEDFE